MRNDEIYRRRLLRPKKPGKLHRARRRAKQNLNLKQRFEGEASVLAGFTATPEIKNINKNEKPLTPFHRLVASTTAACQRSSELTLV